MKAARKLRKLQQPQSLLECVRQFLTPQVWKQARQAVPGRRQKPRWDLQPLILVLLAMTWTAGDSELERFEAARGFYVLSYESRRRPGKTLAGFQKALARIPMRQLWALAQGVRDQIQRNYEGRLVIDGYVPMGCDGSRVECPRSAELESRLGKGSSETSAPTAWVTAFVHLGLGLLWSWRIGTGDADERLHLRQMLVLLPPQALVVADAAYMGYELACAILRHEQSFLLRLSSKNRLYVADDQPLEDWQEGLVYYWPETAQKEKQPPLLCRLIRIQAKGQVKHDVWLLTNILDSRKLTAKTAAKFYRWRWRNEGLFRTYKRTLKKLKLSSRTVKLIHRELEGSLLALQILLAHADLALRPNDATGEIAISPRKVLIEIRREITRDKASTRRTRCYRRRLEKCRAGTRRQASPKASREWPRRKTHKAPAPPKFLTLRDDQKALLQQYFRAA
ncbi:MAG TPA: transposase [Bryobacteraceae bacterium]|nr:transposase [Bryobacteraceae bacterium]